MQASAGLGAWEESLDLNVGWARTWTRAWTLDAGRAWSRRGTGRGPEPAAG